MAIRNFYLVASADGRKSKVGIGPARKDGGMKIELFQRDNGGGKDYPVLKIDCYEFEGKLHTVITDVCGNELIDYITER